MQLMQACPVSMLRIVTASIALETFTLYANCIALETFAEHAHSMVTKDFMSKFLFEIQI